MTWEFRRYSCPDDVEEAMKTKITDEDLVSLQVILQSYLMNLEPRYAPELREKIEPERWVRMTEWIAKLKALDAKLTKRLSGQ